jgi:hypothetical protein
MKFLWLFFSHSVLEKNSEKSNPQIKSVRFPWTINSKPRFCFYEQFFYNAKMRMKKFTYLFYIIFHVPMLFSLFLSLSLSLCFDGLKFKSLNAGLHTCKADILLLEPHFQYPGIIQLHMFFVYILKSF